MNNSLNTLFTQKKLMNSSTDKYLHISECTHHLTNNNPEYYINIFVKFYYVIFRDNQTEYTFVAFSLPFNFISPRKIAFECNF